MKKTVELTQEKIMDITAVLFQRVSQLKSFGTTQKHYLESLEEEGINSVADKIELEEANEVYQDCVNELERYFCLLTKFKELF